ncbi:hypothetical protein [Tamlana sp. I1]|uniref:hypothetical protein n=1 Tax=Tamlana sp. I1 TaxID=2762061 RepID=UPI00188FCE02|nr:hypothetical protein [Tamlana sp. I1]
MKNLLYYIFLITLLSCNTVGKKNIEILVENNDTLISQTTSGSNKPELKNIDSLIWRDKTVKIFAQHKIIEEGEEQLIITNQNKDTLLIFNHEDGGRLTFPFILKNNNQLFLIFFEFWPGSGFLSKKRFYHLSSDGKSVNTIQIINHSNLLKKVQQKFSIKDSIYTRKGEFYKDFAFDKTIFIQDANLPFSFSLFNYTNDSLNRGLAGYKLVKGKYLFVKEQGTYKLVVGDLELTDPQ